MCISHRKAWSRRCDACVCFACDIVSDLFRIQGTLSQHGYHSILQWYAVPSGLGLVGYHCFPTGQRPNTPPGRVRAIRPRRKMTECCKRWPGLHNPPTSTKLRWFGMSWAAEWRKSSQQVLSIYGNSFKTVGKAFQVKLVERMPRVWNAFIKAKGGYLRISNIKYILICLTLFFWLLQDSKCDIS